MTLPLPPVLPGVPLLGNALDLRRDPVALFRRGYETLGPVFTIRLGWKPAAVILGPEAHQFFFSETDRTLSMPEVYRFLIPMFGKVTFAAEPEVYREHRAILQPSFQARRMAGYVETMARETSAWLDTLGDSGSFELGATFEELSMRIAASALLGSEFRQKTGAEFRALYRDVAGGMEFVLPTNLPLPRFRRRDRARTRLHAMLRPMIAERRARPGGHADFMQAFAEATDSRGAPVDEETLVNLLLLLVFAAYETTAAQVAWALLLLLEHPDHLAGVREEAVEVLERGAESVELDTLRRLERLGRALRETERMRPVTTMLSRYTARSYEIGGYHVPRGWMTIISPPVSHRMASVFPDPDVYDPDRFATRRGDERALAGFGGGLHRCMGVHFAQYEMKVILGLLLRSYEVELDGTGPSPDYSTGLTRPQYPCRVRYHRRRPSGMAASGRMQANQAI